MREERNRKRGKTMRDLYEELKAYAGTDRYPFHMPGHKRSGAVSFGDPFAVDITEIDGFDNLHHPEGMLKEMQEEAAAIYGTRQTYFHVNGSSGGILSAICAATKAGDEILVARNCHKSVYHAIVLRRLRPYYLFPDREEETGIAAAIRPEQVAEALRRHPGIRAVVLVSPNYEGVTADVPAIAKEVHAAGAVLIVDEAHGAHLPFCAMHAEAKDGGKADADFPPSALTSGADVVIQSLHKTMPALTQTALVHRVSDRVPRERLEEAQRMFQTSSPSYVLMASIVRAVRWGAEEGGAFRRYADWLKEFRRETGAFACLKRFAPEEIGWTADPGKLVLYDRTGQKSGRELYDVLCLRYGLQPEMCTERYVLLMTSPADTETGIGRLRAALKETDRELESSEPGREDGNRKAAGRVPILRTEPVLTPAEADEAPKEPVSPDAAAGRTAGEYLYLYPPEIPLLVPGERVPEELPEILKEYQEAGISVQGMREKGKLWVIKERI